MADPRIDRLRLKVMGDRTLDLAIGGDRFAEACRKRRGLRVKRGSEGFELSIDPRRIEQLGPVIEAAAAANGLTVVIADLGAEVRSAGLDARPSGVWAAIGNAAGENDVVADRAVTRDPFQYVRVHEVDGALVVVDARPPLVEPTGGPPMDAEPTKYDDIDWHEAAAQAGQPREHAFTHIGLYLAWLIRHDLHDQRSFPVDHIRSVKAGEMTGSDLADDTDWKLLSDLMTADGASFSDARYERYLTDYGELVADESDYGMAEDCALYARVAPLIDRLYADWIRDGAQPLSRRGPRPTTPSLNRCSRRR